MRNKIEAIIYKIAKWISELSKNCPRETKW